VFVFNHQSKADVVIWCQAPAPRHGRHRQAGNPKMPVIGKVLEMGGVVMIDRKNAASAIEAMRPLVEAMRKEGRSVALAPEGTRSVSPNLGPFKKGAFHLAMQAGVPMVPVVIHNAGDVAPKGDFVFRPATVEVDVLPPVDTSDWSPETIDEHVREVRNMFLRTLGQPEEPAPEVRKTGAGEACTAQGRGQEKRHAPGARAKPRAAKTSASKNDERAKRRGRQKRRRRQKGNAARRPKASRRKQPRHRQRPGPKAPGPRPAAQGAAKIRGELIGASRPLAGAAHQERSHKTKDEQHALN
jgi:putative phosphoserine phosphatase/1-acylglycerol-3-phosphate O-acyltransferase